MRFVYFLGLEVELSRRCYATRGRARCVGSGDKLCWSCWSIVALATFLLNLSTMIILDLVKFASILLTERCHMLLLLLDLIVAGELVIALLIQRCT